MDIKDTKFAVLIDADNISYKNIKNILDEIANYGIPTIKRIYGDFTDPKLTSWKGVLLENSIVPIQQYAYTTGKNATDSALIIDAMDILHKEHVDGFCIISSDSDYTRLASRLREAGKYVMGFGERKTPMPFIKSCAKFTYVEILGNTEEAKTPKNSPQRPAKSPKVSEEKVLHAKIQNETSGNLTDSQNCEDKSALLPIDNDLKSLLIHTVNDIGDDDGWAYLGTIGSVITKKRPDFDPRNYGFPKLTLLIKSLKSIFNIEERSTSQPNIKQVYIQNKNKNRRK